MTHTLAQIHFVRGRINHRLRFGKPLSVTKLDKYRSLATFSLGSIFGYIRWSANEYGTRDWRVYVLKAQTTGYISEVAGVTPAVKILASAQGKPAVKRCLAALDAVEKEAGGCLETIPESYWPRFSNALLLRKSPRKLPRNLDLNGASHAR